MALCENVMCFIIILVYLIAIVYYKQIIVLKIYIGGGQLAAVRKSGDYEWDQMFLTVIAGVGIAT